MYRLFINRKSEGSQENNFGSEIHLYEWQVYVQGKILGNKKEFSTKLN